MDALAPLNFRYSYKDAPTLAAFAGCDAFIRGVVGPFGSGKSAACVAELVMRGLGQAPGPDGVRRTRFAVIRNCFDDQTEILTETRGWQLFRDLASEDRVAALHGDELVFEKPTLHYAAPYKGEMIGLRSQHIDMLVTPDHRLWTSKRKTRAKVWAPFDFETASDAYGRTLRRFRITSKWRGAATSYTPEFFRFLGFWFAEGTAGAYQYPDRKEPHWRLVVVQKNGLDEVRKILREAGLAWGETVSRVSGCTYFRMKIGPEMKALVRELAALGPSRGKALPLWIKQAPAELLRAFIDGFLLGDGTLAGGCVPTACTSSRQMADDLQEIAIKTGRAAMVLSGPVWRGKNSFHANTTHTFRVSLRAPSRCSPRARGWYKVDYDGTVYCVEVSTHVVLVRRNGLAHWSSQTYGELKDTTIKTVEQWLPEAHFGRHNRTDHNFRITAFPRTEIEVIFRALDRPEHLKHLLSLELTGAWINEAREVPWAIVEGLQARVDRYPAEKDGGPTWAGIWMDTNPPDTDSKWYKFFEEKGWTRDFEKAKRAGDLPKEMRAEDFAQVFHQPGGRDAAAENVTNLPGGRMYYTRLALGKTPEWIKVYVDGQYGFVVEGKLVYPEYSDRVHCQKADPVEGVPIVRSWDFGLTPACIFSQMQPNGQWLTFDEMVSENMSIDEFSDEVMEHSSRSFRGRATFEDWGDPAGAERAQTDKRSCFDIMRNKGIQIEPALTQEPTLRQEAVRKVLRTLVSGEPQFILHPRCQVLRKGFMGGYHRRRLNVPGAERYSEKPDKNSFSHPHDALQYGLVQYFGRSLTEAEREEDFPEPNDYARDATRSEVTGY